MRVTDRGGREREVPLYSVEEVSAYVEERAREAGREALANRARQFRWCVCQNPVAAPREATFSMTHKDCGTTFAGLRSCDLRACPRCNGRRFADSVEDYEAKMRAGNVQQSQIRFLTLTVPNVRDLSAGLRKLQDDVKKLRRRPWFQQYARSGVVAYQWTKYGATWHVHAHLVLVGAYIPRALVMEAWTEIQGGDARDAGVDVRFWRGSPIQAFKEALGYVYPTKARRYAELQDYATVELDLKGRRLTQSWGDFYGVSRVRPPKCCPYCEQEGGAWQFQGTPTDVEWGAFIAALSSGDFSGSPVSLVPTNREHSSVARARRERSRRERESGAYAC